MHPTRTDDTGLRKAANRTGERLIGRFRTGTGGTGASERTVGTGTRWNRNWRNQVKKIESQWRGLRGVVFHAEFEFANET